MLLDILKERSKEDFDALYLGWSRWQGVICKSGTEAILAVQESSSDTQYDIVVESYPA